MSFFAELKRRNVIRMAGLYLVGAWLIVQVAETLLPIFGAPEWVLKTLVMLLALGFVPALVFAWVFELTPEGLKRDDDVPIAASIAPQTARRMDRLIVAGLITVIALMAAERIWFAGEDEMGSESFSGPALAAIPAPRAPENESDPISSIAVLPFVDLSAERDQAYFGDGIAEELLNVLAQVEGLSVASRTSSFAFKDKSASVREIAASLGVAHVVEGSVRKAGNHLRITAQLIDVSRDRHLWSKTFDREFTDVFAIQDEIARAIADALRVTLGVSAKVAAGTDNVAAYDLYLLGMYHWHQRTPESLQRALQIFQQTVARDPDFARAEAGLAMTYVVLGGYADVDKDETTRAALLHARRAVQLDPQSFEAHTALGGVLGLNLFQRDEALAALDRAIEINPKFATAHHWRGITLTQRNELDAGEVALRTAHELDPASLPAQNYLAINLNKQGRYAEALALNEALLQRSPDYRNALFDAFRNASRLGREREFEGHLARYLTVIGEDSKLATNIVSGILEPAQRAAAIALVEGIAPRHRQGGKADQIAVLFALLGARNQLLDLLAYISADLDYLDSFEFLDGDPRFEAWRARVDAQRKGVPP